MLDFFGIPTTDLRQPVTPKEAIMAHASMYRPIILSFFFGTAMTAWLSCSDGSSDPITTPPTDASAEAGDSDASTDAAVDQVNDTTTTEASTAWSTTPGKPGSVTVFGNHMPNIQSMSGQKLLTVMSGGGQNKCPNAPVEPEEDSATDADTDEENPEDACIGYQPKDPVIDTAGVSVTSIRMALVSAPIYHPAEAVCGHEPKELAVNGRLFILDCSGKVEQIPAFADQDPVDFFGQDKILPLNTQIELEGTLMTIITGEAVKSALCGNDVFVVSNASTRILKFSVDGDGQWTRNEYDTGTYGLSGLMCDQDGHLVFSTARTFTLNSWNNAWPEPGNLVEAQPIRIQRLNPGDGTFSTIAEISGKSKVLTQSALPTTGDIQAEYTEVYLAGIANILTTSPDGHILFGDHLEGTLWKISYDGVTKEKILESDRLFTGVAQTPKGVIYLALNAIADTDCKNMLAPPMVGAVVNGSIVDWLVPEPSEYTDLTLTLCKTGIIERDPAGGRAFLGGGDFSDLSADLEGNLFKSETIKGRVLAIQVMPDPVPTEDASTDAPEEPAEEDAEPETGEDASTDAPEETSDEDASDN